MTLLEKLESAFPEDAEVTIRGQAFQLTEPDYGDVMKLQMKLEKKRVSIPIYGSDEFNKLNEKGQEDAMEKWHDIYWKYVVDIISLCLVTKLPTKMIYRICKRSGDLESPIVRESFKLSGIKEVGGLTDADDPFLSQKSTDGKSKKS